MLGAEAVDERGASIPKNVKKRLSKLGLDSFFFVSVTGYHVDLSTAGARVSVRVLWSEYDVRYEVPEA